MLRESTVGIRLSPQREEIVLQNEFAVKANRCFSFYDKCMFYSSYAFAGFLRTSHRQSAPEVRKRNKQARGGEKRRETALVKS